MRAAILGIEARIVSGSNTNGRRLAGPRANRGIHHRERGKPIPLGPRARAIGTDINASIVDGKHRPAGGTGRGATLKIRCNSQSMRIPVMRLINPDPGTRIGGLTHRKVHPLLVTRREVQLAARSRVRYDIRCSARGSGRFPRR